MGLLAKDINEVNVGILLPERNSLYGNQNTEAKCMENIFTTDGRGTGTAGEGRNYDYRSG